jgi:hypothetical protein
MVIKDSFLSMLLSGAVFLLLGAAQVAGQAATKVKEVVKPQTPGNPEGKNSKAKSIQEPDLKERLAAYERLVEKRRVENVQNNAAAMAKADSSLKEREQLNRAAMLELEVGKKDSSEVKIKAAKKRK